MRFFLCVLFFFAAGMLTASAEDLLIWKSERVTCEAIAGGQTVALGYATIHRTPDGDEYRRWCDFLGDRDAGGLSDIGMPADGSWPVNMTGIEEATHVRVTSDGRIILY